MLQCAHLIHRLLRIFFGLLSRLENSVLLRKPFSVLVVIYNNKNEFLLIQRADDPTFWQSVTGGIECGETALQTAQRELLEETGIDVNALNLAIAEYDHTNQYPIRPQWLHRYVEGSTINTEYVFSVQVPAETRVTLNPDEHLDFVWLNSECAIEKAWSLSNKKEIKFIASSIMDR